MANLTWRWPWLIAALGLALIVIASATLLLTRRRGAASAKDHPRQGTASVWSLDEDLKTETAAKAVRLWRRMNRLGALLLALSLVLTTLLAARPSDVDRNRETGRSRDIVLCLDVSGSTLPYDRQVIEAYLNLVNDFHGERIALSIFNSTSRTVFPLTDDYDLVTRQLKQADTILKGVQSQDDIDKMSDKQYQAISDWLEGTQDRKDTTSLIGDGLVSCAAMLPGFSTSVNGAGAAAKTRSSSIVLATDNVVSGNPTYTLQEALELTHAAGIGVDGLYSGPKQSEGDPPTQQMRALIEGQGGVFLLQGSADSIASLVERIERRHGGDLQSIRRSSLVDTPRWWALALSLALGAYLIAVWRLKR
ncbi:Von Willebrand factor type A domain protein [Bifidobacterium actinocoloniiforme DSM 22766]|uniref:von Willebrand factor type A domain protein n=1 Tax=Bifidobacterium actinocoloniiforme DSM 22766 TaxID=1437605 RepID=A0A086Z174_9BIFI|nr:VWA domain-containing protein [Bifidobacterium actinocoloniiforme]AKV55438.1 von Willebrand factor A [Bifidobacterium actinocoloniiforme DSM 22766]KFI40274.1 Von Willebrand factor type A domain protein [Bifidobacterium actinocoloniiforme DSM 22766]